MKTTKQMILAATATIILNSAMAQDWTIGGNNVAGAGATRLFGITGPNNKHLVFVNGNSGGVPIERGRITNTGLWGIGTTNPGALFHINSDVGQNPLTVQLNGSTKISVNSLGGLTLGAPTGFPLAPTNNNVFVPERLGIGTSAPSAKLHIINGTDAEPGGGGFIIAGETASTNVAIDNNEIMARNGGLASTLSLNHDGGDINMSNGGLFVDAIAGSVGVNTTTPGTEMHVLHDLGSGLTHGLRLQNTGANGQLWTFYVQNANGALELYSNSAFRGSFDELTGDYTSVSDARFKKDIEAAPDILEKIMQLNVKKYHFTKSRPGDKKSFGLIAQETEKIFPELVKLNMQDDGSNIYTMNYAALGVLAIKGLQEQHQAITLLKEQVELLKKQNEDLLSRLQKPGNTNAAGSSTISDAVLPNASVSLEQNAPNPFNQATTIRYHIPDAANASIIVYNSNGAPVKSFKATAKGFVTINAGELATGSYTYCLMLNGKAFASKKMILVK